MQATDMLDEPLTEELEAELAEQCEAAANVTYDFEDAIPNHSYFDLLPRVPSKGAPPPPPLHHLPSLLPHHTASPPSSPTAPPPLPFPNLCRLPSLLPTRTASPSLLATCTTSITTLLPTCVASPASSPLALPPLLPPHPHHLPSHVCFEGALAAANEGLRRFEEASPEERSELPGTLTWLLFSPTTRDDAPNPIFDDVKAFAAGEINPFTGVPYPYRCWPKLTKVLVAEGAKFCPSTSAQLESLFNGLTRQQGASKNNISQPQISFEARCRKNDTMDSLTEHVLRDNWADAKAVQDMLEAKGFWVCDLGLAADRKLSQKLKEQREVELARDVTTMALTRRIRLRHTRWRRL